MQSPDTTETADAPLVPHVTDAATDADTTTVASDGGRPATETFDRPPRTDYATDYTRDEEEIEPFVPDLR